MGAPVSVWFCSLSLGKVGWRASLSAVSQILNDLPTTLTEEITELAVLICIASTRVPSFFFSSKEHPLESN